MRLALAITLSTPTALYAQPAPVAPAPAEPTPSSPTESEAPTPQPTPAGKPPKSYGLDAVAVVPLSDYADDATIGLGALFRLVIPRNDVIALTLRTGGVFHVVPDNRDTLLLFPAFVGLQLRFADRWVFVADAGMMLRSQGKTTATVGLAFGVGYRAGKVQFRGELLVPDLGAVDSTAGVLASLGFSL